MIVVVEAGAYERLEPGMIEVDVWLEVSVEDSQGHSLCHEVHKISVCQCDRHDGGIARLVQWGRIEPIKWLEEHIVRAAVEGSDLRVEREVANG